MTRLGDERNARPIAHGAIRVLQRAAEALDRGDRYLHVQQALRMSRGTSVADSWDASGRYDGDCDLLGALSDIGWDLEHVSYVPVDPGPARGPSTGSNGFGAHAVMGIYLMRASRRPRPHPRSGVA